MPQISRTISSLVPKTFDSNNPNSQASWFSYIRTVYSRQRGGTILPPTRKGFLNEWPSSPTFVFRCEGDTLEECKNNLSDNNFPPIHCQRRTIAERNKNITWTRMIMAFNMYAEVRKEFRNSTDRQIHKIDFIGSKQDSNCHTINTIINVFNGRKALFLPSDIIQNLITLTATSRLSSYNERDTTYTRRFWNYIFEIYDNIINPNVSSVSREVNVSQEYMNREDSDNIDLNIDNQQIANMILNTEVVLPDDIKKMIYDAYIALSMSHSL